MKKLLTIALVLALSTSVMAAETKKVCHDKVVKGKTVNQCKTIKVHRKFEGKKISDAIPSKPVKKQVNKKTK